MRAFDSATRRRPVRASLRKGIDMPKVVIVGGPGVGTDAGGWVIDERGVIHRIPGWNPEAVLETQRAMGIIREAAQLKTPGLAEATTKAAVEFVFDDLNRLIDIPDGDIVIGGSGTDAPTVVLHPDGTIGTIPGTGWAPEAQLEFQHAVSIVREATQLKTPGLAETTAKPAVEYIHKEATETFGQGVIAIFG
jgi:hypothetical protein